MQFYLMNQFQMRIENQLNKNFKLQIQKFNQLKLNWVQLK